VLCQSKQTEEVSPVTYPICHKNDLSENQEYLKITTNERKDDKLPQKYMWAPLFSKLLVRYPTHSRKRIVSRIMIIMHPRTFVQMSFVAFYLCNSVGGDWTGCYYFHKKNCETVSEKLTTMSFIIALIVVKREAKVFRTI